MLAVGVALTASNARAAAAIARASAEQLKAARIVSSAR